MIKYSISVIGAGNGGQAMAGHLSLMGHDVLMYTRDTPRFFNNSNPTQIRLSGVVIGVGNLRGITDDLAKAVGFADILMITTTADAHGSIAKSIIPYLKEGQIVVLNPGRTGGALEVRQTFRRFGLRKSVFVVECQSLVYACRAESPGDVCIIGIKDRVQFSTLPATDLPFTTPILQSIFPCMEPVNNVLITSLENVGAIFHPTIVLFNTAAIERGNMFYFYNDITPHISSFLINLDAERLLLGKAFGIKLHSVEEWISFAYKGTEGDTLYEKMKNNPAYSKIRAPTQLRTRLLMEDLPTGILPMIELGSLVRLQMPVMRALYQIGSTLLNEDFRKSGRTLERLGLSDASKGDIYSML